MGAAVVAQGGRGILHDLQHQAREGALADGHPSPRQLKQADPKRPDVCRLCVPAQQPRHFGTWNRVCPCMSNPFAC